MKERIDTFAISNNKFEIDIFDPLEVRFLSNETGNLIPSLGEFFTQMASYKACSSCHQGFHRAKLF
jgi:hypothetical protein